MNRCQKNHNPLNLRFARQKEAMGKDDLGYAVFPDPPSGWRAAHHQIELDQGRGDSIKTFLREFAPSNENDTEAYIKFVCDQLHCDRGDSLGFFSKYAIAGIMAQFEGYYNA